MFFSVVCSGGRILYRRVRVQNCMLMEGLAIPDVFVFEESKRTVYTVCSHLGGPVWARVPICMWK